MSATPRRRPPKRRTHKIGGRKVYVGWATANGRIVSYKWRIGPYWSTVTR